MAGTLGSSRRPAPVGVLLTAVVGMGALSIDMFLPSLPAMASGFGSDVAAAQLTVTLFLVGFAVAQLVFGPVSDRFGRRRALLAGLALYAVAGVGCLVAPGIRTLIAARVLQALGAASGPVVGRAIVRDSYEPARAARVLGYMGTAQALTPILAPIVGGYLHVAFGWRSVFLVLAALGVLFFVAAVALVPETNVQRDPDALRPARIGANVRRLLTDEPFMGYVVVLALMFSGQFAFISGSSFVLISVLGVSPDLYGLCFGLVAVGIMAGSFVSGRYAPRVGIDRLIRAGTLLGAVAGTVMAALAWAGVATVPAVIAPMCVFSMGVGLVLPTGMAGAIGPFPRMAGTASAVVGFLQMTGSAAYGIAVGRLYDGTPRPMATAIGVAGLAALAGFAVLSARRPRA